MVTAAFWVIRWGMIMLWLMCQSVVVPLYQPITAAGTCTISPECNISVETYRHTSKLMWSLCWLIHFLSVLLHHALFSPVLCSLTAPSVSGSSSVCRLCIHLYFFSVQVPGCVWGTCQERVFPWETVYLWICSGDQDIPAIIPYAVYCFYLHCK